MKKYGFLKKTDLPRNPQVFYETYIKGRDAEDLTCLIFAMKDRINHLAECIEDSWEDDMMAEAFEDWARYVPYDEGKTGELERQDKKLNEYLAYAVKEYKAVTGTPWGDRLTPAELKVKRFNDRLPLLKSLEFKAHWEEDGVTEVIVLTIEGQSVRYVRTANETGEPVVQERIDRPSNTKVLLRTFEDLGIGKWNKEYRDKNSCGDDVWSVKFEFETGAPVVITGDDAFPRKFLEFIHAIWQRYDPPEKKAKKKKKSKKKKSPKKIDTSASINKN